jgi:hypothetical protein
MAQCLQLPTHVTVIVCCAARRAPPRDARSADAAHQHAQHIALPGDEALVTAQQGATIHAQLLRAATCSSLSCVMGAPSLGLLAGACGTASFPPLQRAPPAPWHARTCTMLLLSTSACSTFSTSSVFQTCKPGGERTCAGWVSGEMGLACTPLTPKPRDTPLQHASQAPHHPQRDATLPAQLPSTLSHCASIASSCSDLPAAFARHWPHDWYWYTNSSIMSHSQAVGSCGRQDSQRQLEGWCACSGTGHCHQTAG